VRQLLPRASRPVDDAGEDLRRTRQRSHNLPPKLVTALAEADLIHPARINSTLSYSAQDRRVLQLASALRAARISAAKIIAALGNILAVLQIDAESPTRHHVLPLFVDTRPPTPTARRRRENEERRRLEATRHFETALALEDSDLQGARASYLAALDAHSEHLEARINLGRLLHLNGELEQAEKIYREAKQASALLSFNLAILLEDLNREEEAVLAYREALALDPGMHDAHFNLSRLHERADRPREALQHLLTYRRHTLRED
jgi:tetratricopeptide (TPR) repeat protein